MIKVLGAAAAAAAIGAAGVIFGPTAVGYFWRSDDPAIAACEAGPKSELTEGMTYRRVSVQMAGVNVDLKYELQYKKDASQQHTLECDFRYIQNDDVFVFDYKVAPSECAEFTRRKADRWEEELLAICIRLAEAKLRLKTLQEGAVRGLGIYPIPAKATALKKPTR